ncbi:MAG: hypothetical protein LEGION0403_FIIPPAGN_01689 [Legionella sp.]|uniref:hypothetical protein n=1 Tax=Legionella sp. TaxID=459 RepID=UPI003D09CF32
MLSDYRGLMALSHKGFNNRVENAHQPTCRNEKCLIGFKSPAGAQNVLALMGKTRFIDFGKGEKLATTIPWGDVSTAFYTTGIPNIEVYTHST